MSETKPMPPDPVAALCPNCGLCCNGVLFRDVELDAADTVRLHDLGVVLKRSSAKARLPQPCSCFDGKFCRIYTDRPARCAAFECGLLKRAQAGELSTDAALKRIIVAKKLAARVRDLLRQLGNADEHLPLTRRYAKVMKSPVDLSNHDAAEARGELMMAVSELMQLLHREFLEHGGRGSQDRR